MSREPIREFDSLAQVVEVLRKGVFHVTDKAGYEAIRRSEAILAATGPSLWPLSFARQQGYVPLFDFREVSETQLEDIHGTWQHLFLKRDSDSAIGLRIDVEELGASYISNAERSDAPGFKIPYVEGWSSKPVPWAYVLDGFVYRTGFAIEFIDVDSMASLL